MFFITVGGNAIPGSDGKVYTPQS